MFFRLSAHTVRVERKRNRVSGRVCDDVNPPFSKMPVGKEGM
jgi:hypothetical protein